MNTNRNCRSMREVITFLIVSCVYYGVFFGLLKKHNLLKCKDVKCYKVLKTEI